MKKISILFVALFGSLYLTASELVLIHTGSMEKTKQAFSTNGLTVNYFSDHFIIGTAHSALPLDYQIIDGNPWNSQNEYFLIRFNPSEKDSYLESVKSVAEILYQSDDFLIVSVEKSRTAELYPSVHGGLVRISQNQAKLHEKPLNYRSGSLDSRDDIWTMIGQVDTARLRQLVQHLQDFGTRNAYKSGGILAQDWIFSKFDSLGLEVELHDFSMPQGPASDNVIATLTGTKYPDEFVVLGAHYDSYAGGSYEPGADDNATGTAGILEIARILSQYQFDRSIIFACWSGEEYGLYGSEAWADEAAQNGMNILGYFNIDMAGYLEPGSYIHTDVIGPASAGELKQFYKDVCAIYLPDFEVGNGALSGGDSDHTSFNNAGYQGIFPFEDSQNYSPYIHSTNDIIGPSVNNFEQHGVFVQATLASVVSMSDLLPSPENLTGIAGDGEVVLNWTALDSVDHYNIYRNGGIAPFATTSEINYTDLEVTNGDTYTYYITAVFMVSGEESGPSNVVTVVPMPPIAFPFYDDFETGAPYWSFESPWGLQSGIYHSSSFSMTESPAGNYGPNMDVSATLRSLDLNGATSAQISFWARYQLESDYDFMYLEVSTNGLDWDQLASYTGNQNTWTQFTYPLNNYLNKENVVIRFHFTSDVYVEAQGMFIDDIEIDVVGVGIGDNPEATPPVIRILPNPAEDFTVINLTLSDESTVLVTLTDATGREIIKIADERMNKGSHSRNIDLSGMNSGIYFIVVETSGRKYSRKLIVSR